MDAQALMATTNNAAAKASAAQLQTLWASNRLTATQQGKVVALAQQMLAKRFKPRPHFENLFDLVVAAKGPQALSDTQTDQLLDVLTKTVDKEDPRETEKFLANIAQFLQTRYLYRSRYKLAAGRRRLVQLRLQRNRHAGLRRAADAARPGPQARARPGTGESCARQGYFETRRQARSQEEK